MFERYTEKARRAIFFARYEASQFGATEIEPEHLLLGLLRDQQNMPQLTRDLRIDLETMLPRNPAISTSVDMPLSHSAKICLAYAAEEAESSSDPHITPEHLVIGILTESESRAAQILNARGINREVVREWMPQSRDAARKNRNYEIVAQLRSEIARLSADLPFELEPAITFLMRTPSLPE
jgi:ATP-dependent Clp protease ATP-binding subunit ClpC